MASMSGLHRYNLRYIDVSNDMDSKEFTLPKVYLMPGELYFGDTPVKVSTLLGSCVAVTLWSECFHSGGMCHIVLPNSDLKSNEMHPRYVTGAISHFLEYLRKYRLKPKQLRVGVFGGGHALERYPEESNISIGMRNVQQVNALLQAEGFNVSHRDVGGNVYRKLTLNLADGTVWQSKHTHQDENVEKQVWIS